MTAVNSKSTRGFKEVRRLGSANQPVLSGFIWFYCLWRVLQLTPHVMTDTTVLITCFVPPDADELAAAFCHSG